MSASGWRSPAQPDGYQAPMDDAGDHPARADSTQTAYSPFIGPNILDQAATNHQTDHWSDLQQSMSYQPYRVQCNPYYSAHSHDYRIQVQFPSITYSLSMVTSYQVNEMDHATVDDCIMAWAREISRVHRLHGLGAAAALQHDFDCLGLSALNFLTALPEVLRTLPCHFELFE